MTELTKPMSLIEALTLPAQQILEQVRGAVARPAPHWTDYLRETRGQD